MKKRYNNKHQYFPLYDSYCDGFLMESVILNGGNDKRITVNTIFWDKENCRKVLQEYRGDEQGLWKRRGEETIAHIPNAKYELAQVEKAFVRYQTNRVNLGYAKSDEYPFELLDKKLYWEARLDVMDAEVEALEKKIASFVEKVEETDDSKVLAYGLQGSGKCWGSTAPSRNLTRVMKIIDGQNVYLTGDGLLIIKDSRSPYNGMALVDYRALCVQWQSDRKVQARAKLVQIQAECKSKGFPVPESFVFPFKKVDKKSLPPFPANAVNHLEKQEVNEDKEDSSKLTRSRKTAYQKL